MSNVDNGARLFMFLEDSPTDRDKQLSYLESFGYRRLHGSKSYHDPFSDIVIVNNNGLLFPLHSTYYNLEGCVEVVLPKDWRVEMKKVFIEVPVGADREPYIAYLESLGFKRKTHIGAYGERCLQALACSGVFIGWSADVQRLLDNGYERIEMPQQKPVDKQHPHKEAIEKWLSDTSQKIWVRTDRWIEIAVTTLVDDAIGHHVEIRVQHDPPKKKIKIGSYWVDEPESCFYDYGREYFIPTPSDLAFYSCDKWRSRNIDAFRLKAGLVHLTKEAAMAHAKALISLTGEFQ